MNTRAERLTYFAAPHAALPALFIAPLFLLSLTPRADVAPHLTATLWGAALALSGWLVVLLVGAARAGRTLDFDVQIVRTHWVQALVHTSIYVYWSQYWGFIAGQVPLILAQILFAYSFSILLAWTRGQRYRFGFGPLPIILSTNFFMCFKDDWFYFQFAMIALGMLGKEFIHWRRDGRDTHIFNPSALALFAVSLVLIATKQTGITWAEPIAIELDRPEHIYLFIFLVGLLVQGLFHVTLVTLAAALALYVLNVVYFQATGIYWFMDAGIPIAVFLGLHLLITDPATSPRTSFGRFLFGALYGAGVFFLYGLLEWLGAPRFYDKLLCVPLLNIIVQQLDRLARALPSERLPVFSKIARLTPNGQNLLYMGAWVLLFAWMSATDFIGKDHPGLKTAFWDEACSQGLHNGCRNLANIRRDDCTAGHADACLQLATLATGSSTLQRQPLAAIRALARACDLSSAPACFALKDRLDAQAVGELTSSCRGGDSESCYILGSVHLFGIGRAADLPAAERYFERSCELGYPTGCSVGSDFYRLGVGGIPKDAARALSGHEKACYHTYLPSCVTVADMLSRGEGTARDLRRARALLEETCRLEYVPACTARAAGSPERL